MEFEEITEKIIGCAYTVYNKLGHGFLESVYQKALMIELHKAGLKAVCNVAIDVYYDGVVVGQFVADTLVEDEIMLELKAIRAITSADEKQLSNYLAATGKPVGLVINFSESGVQIRRKDRSSANQRIHPHDPLNPLNLL